MCTSPASPPKNDVLSCQFKGRKNMSDSTWTSKQQSRVQPKISNSTNLCSAWETGNQVTCFWPWTVFQFQMNLTDLHAAPNQQPLLASVVCFVRHKKNKCKLILQRDWSRGTDVNVGCVLRSDNLHGVKQQDLALKDQGQRNEIVAHFLFNHCGALKPCGSLYSQMALHLEILNFTFYSQSTELNRC